MTPQQPAGVPQHIQIEMARRELKLLTEQRNIAEQGIAALSDVSADLADFQEMDGPAWGRAALSALVALVSLRLLELKHSHGNLMARVAELEGALKVADSGIVRPRMA